ncbi:hypothetical protein XM25_19915 [Devosia sp. H5989]|nr:hypothetical protein XM25_19915 [Devosia sp. H5989]
MSKSKMKLIAFPHGGNIPAAFSKTGRAEKAGAHAPIEVAAEYADQLVDDRFAYLVGGKPPVPSAKVESPEEAIARAKEIMGKAEADAKAALDVAEGKAKEIVTVAEGKAKQLVLDAETSASAKIGDAETRAKEIMGKAEADAKSALDAAEGKAEAIVADAEAVAKAAKAAGGQSGGA